MPFDAMPAMPERPDLSKPTPQALVWLLRHQEAWPKAFAKRGWCYADCTSCALGLAEAQWSQPGRRLFIDDGNVVFATNVARAFTGGDINAVHSVFAVAHHDHSLPTLYHVQPEHVANALEAVMVRHALDKVARALDKVDEEQRAAAAAYLHEAV